MPTALHSAENHLREASVVSNTRMRKHSLPDGQSPEGAVPGVGSTVHVGGKSVLFTVVAAVALWVIRVLWATLCIRRTPVFVKVPTSSPNSPPLGELDMRNPMSQTYE